MAGCFAGLCVVKRESAQLQQTGSAHMHALGMPP